MSTTPRSSGARASGPSALAKLPTERRRDARQEAILKTIRTTGLTPRQAALSCEVATSVFYEWMETADFRERVAMAEATFERRMAGGIVADAINMNSWRAKAWVLEHRLGFSERWSAVSKVEVEVTLEDQMEEATDEELRARSAALVEEALRRLPDAERVGIMERQP